MATFEQFIKSIQLDGNDGKAFEIFVKWFLKNDPEWSTQVEDVWLWDEWPDKWGPDNGIDLVFQHKNGDIWAVQAKCYDSKYPVSKKDMDTFLSESSRSVIKSRLLVTSTDHMSANAIRTCKHQEKPVVRFMLRDFENATIDYPSHISELNTAKRRPKPTPRPHQQKAIDDVAAGFVDKDRGQMIMACGTGKTFTSLWVKERLEARSTLVLLPSLSLLSQTLRE
jgi:predicted helicase